MNPCKIEPGMKKSVEKRFKKIVVFPITGRAFGIAGKLAEEFNGALVYAPSELKGSLKKRVRENFRKGNALVFIGAAAICVRAISSFLRRKDLDPAVVAVDELGRFAISLLSGHLGGANLLASRIAEALGGTPVITTATDVSGLPSVEDLAERLDLAIEDVKGIKRVNSAILEGRDVSVIDPDARRLERLRSLYGSGVFSFKRRFPPRRENSEYVLITSLIKSVPPPFRDRTLILRPREFVVGIGTCRGVGVRLVEKAVREAFLESGISPLSIKRIATVDLKADEPGLLEFAERMGVPVEYFSCARLNRVPPPSGDSKIAMERIGARGVCEPSALLSSGERELWSRKRKKGRVTIAIARAPFTS